MFPGRKGQHIVDRVSVSAGAVESIVAIISLDFAPVVQLQFAELTGDVLVTALVVRSFGLHGSLATNTLTERSIQILYTATDVDELVWVAEL